MIKVLYDMLNDLKQHHRDVSYLEEMYLEDRLNKSFKTYYDELRKSVERLCVADDIKVVKGLNRW